MHQTQYFFHGFQKKNARKYIFSGISAGVAGAGRGSLKPQGSPSPQNGSIGGSFTHWLKNNAIFLLHKTPQKPPHFHPKNISKMHHSTPPKNTTKNIAKQQQNSIKTISTNYIFVTIKTPPNITPFSPKHQPAPIKYTHNTTHTIKKHYLPTNSYTKNNPSQKCTSSTLAFHRPI